MFLWEGAQSFQPSVFWANWEEITAAVVWNFSLRLLESLNENVESWTNNLQWCTFKKKHLLKWHYLCVTHADQYTHPECEDSFLFLLWGGLSSLRKSWLHYIIRVLCLTRAQWRPQAKTRWWNKVALINLKYCWSFFTSPRQNDKAGDLDRCCVGFDAWLKNSRDFCKVLLIWRSTETYWSLAVMNRIQKRFVCVCTCINTCVKKMR